MEHAARQRAYRAGARISREDRPGGTPRRRRPRRRRGGRHRRGRGLLRPRRAGPRRPRAPLPAGPPRPRWMRPLRPEQLLVVNCPGTVSRAALERSATSSRPAAACSPPTGRSPRHRARLPRHGGLQRAGHRRRRRPHRGRAHDNPFLTGVMDGRRRPPVVAGGLVLSDPGPRPEGVGAHHQPGAGGEVRRGRRGRHVPLGRGRGVPHDLPLLPPAHRAAHRPPRHGGHGLHRGEGLPPLPGAWSPTSPSATSSRPASARMLANVVAAKKRRSLSGAEKDRA